MPTIPSKSQPGPVPVNALPMDPIVKEFYDSLRPKEREAHDIAARMLGSSYIVDQTHSFLRWKKLRDQPPLDSKK
jgi:hypothetical protein